MTRIDGGTQIEAHQGDSKVVSITVELEDVEQLVWGFIEDTDSTATALQVESYKIDFLTTNPISVDEQEIIKLDTFYKITQQNSRGEDGTIADHTQFNVSINTERPGTWIYQVRLNITYTDSTDVTGRAKTITQMLIPDGIIKVTGGGYHDLGNLSSEIKILIDAFDIDLTAVKDKTAAIKRKGSTTRIADENVIIDGNVKIGLKTDGEGVIEVDNAAKTASYTMSHQDAAELSELANKAYVDANIQNILGAAPQELNSLGKIAEALRENSNHDRESEERIGVLEDKTAHIVRVDENIVNYGGDIRYSGQTNSHQYKMAGQVGYSDFANKAYVDGLVGVLSSLAVKETERDDIVSAINEVVRMLDTHETEVEHLHADVKQFLGLTEPKTDNITHTLAQVIALLNDGDDNPDTSIKNLIDLIDARVKYTDVVNALDSALTDKPLSAYQGNVLNGKIDGLSTNKLDTATFNSFKETNTSAINSKVNTSDFDTFKSNNTTALSGKVDNSTLNAYQQEVTTALGKKLNSTDISAWAKATTKPSYSKSEVGLSNVDNTADSAKNVNSAVKDGNGRNIVDTYATNERVTDLRKEITDGFLAVSSDYDVEKGELTINYTLPIESISYDDNTGLATFVLKN